MSFPRRRESNLKTVRGNLLRMNINNKEEKNISFAFKSIILVIALVPVGLFQYLHGKYHLPHVLVISPLVGIFMLLWGIFIKQKFYKKNFKLFSFNKWPIALVLLIGLELIQLLLVKPRLSFELDFTKTLYKAFFFLVIVGFTEELWFRGIWFAMFKENFIPCVLVGSIIFGLFHLPGRNFAVLYFTFVTGLTFAIARFRGASILSLTIVHGIMDFLNTSAFSGQARFGILSIFVIFTFACLFLSGVIIFTFKSSNSYENSLS